MKRKRVKGPVKKGAGKQMCLASFGFVQKKEKKASYDEQKNETNNTDSRSDRSKEDCSLDDVDRVNNQIHGKVNDRGDDKVHDKLPKGEIEMEKSEVESKKHTVNIEQNNSTSEGVGEEQGPKYDLNCVDTNIDADMASPESTDDKDTPSFGVDNSDSKSECDVDETNNKETEKENKEETETPDDSQMSSYEQARLANIAMNEEFLASLGLGEEKRNMRKRSEKPKPAKRQRSKVSRARAEVTLPRRASARLRSGGARGAASTEANVATQDAVPEVEETVSFATSRVHYFCETGGQHNSETALQKDRFTLGSRSWSDPSLKKIYAMDTHPTKSIFAAAGHGGVVSIYPLNSDRSDEEDIEPLLSFKSSKGWCAAVQFLKTSMSEQVLMLTASNDGSLVLWDAGKEEERTGVAAKVSTHTNVHSSGIFSMHHFSQGLVATASKDKTAALSTVDEAGVFSTVARFDAHQGVIKCVRMRDVDVLATTGNDLCIHVWDQRNPSDPVLSIVDAHDFAINSVRWHPVDPNLLVNSSFGPGLRLFDIRSTKEPVKVFQVPYQTSRSKSISHPLFFQQGARLLSPIEGHDILANFDVSTGEIVSEGSLGFHASALLSSPNESFLLAAHGKQIMELC